MGGVFLRGSWMVNLDEVETEGESGYSCVPCKPLGDENEMEMVLFDVLRLVITPSLRDDASNLELREEGLWLGVYLK